MTAEVMVVIVMHLHLDMTASKGKVDLNKDKFQRKFSELKMSIYKRNAKVFSS